MSGDSPDSVVDRISSASFADWYDEREFARNIRQGQPYFNGPPRVPDPERHSPSQLMQCHRKMSYRKANAPAETEEPEGIFWAGRRFEEDVIVPYLQDSAVDEDTYVRNSMWVDETIDVDGTEVRVKGATDPVIVTAESEPVLVTEVKTTTSLEYKDSPSTHHRAQVHAYMYGLNQEYNREVTEAVVIYGDRETLDVRAFNVAFDSDFWSDLLKWAATQTEYRDGDELPPATPEQDWECGFCAYQHRCGESDEPYVDHSPKGLLPMFEGYPREQVIEYLEAHDGAKLTPTLADKYPALADTFPVRDWYCPMCESTYDSDSIGWDTDQHSRQMCPKCADNGELSELQLSNPE